MEGLGYEILQRNFCCRGGEIDLIAKENGYLVFVEVKYRKASDYGMPQESVDKRKAARMLRAAKYYMYREGIPEETPCRFDAVAILGSKISVFRNVFEA